MEEFYLGETITCLLNIRSTDNGEQITPSDVYITLKRQIPNTLSCIPKTLMYEKSTGVYSYNIQTEGYEYGEYEITYQVLFGEYAYIRKDKFIIK